MKTQTKKAALPVEEWNFRLCPERERAACFHYEYAREYVQTRPELVEKLTGKPRPSPYNNHLKFVWSDKRHPDSLPMICRRFPAIPWLKLPAKTRIRLIALCQLLPEEDETNSNLLVEGDFDVAQLQHFDKARKGLFAKWMQDSRDQNDRSMEALSTGSRVVEQSIERPALCNGPKRYYAINEHVALAVIELDWTRTDRALLASFKRLLKRRPPETVEIAKKLSKGGRGGISDQLKKLGAKRLRSYYGSYEAAVEAIQLTYSSTRAKPPYSDADALRNAASRVEAVLEDMQHTGRFHVFANL